MAKIKYVEKTFRASTLEVIDQANEIIGEYQAQGFDLTLRQLYYQFVARDLLPNNQKSYNRLGSIANDGRLAGLIDWSALEDRTRNLQRLSHFRNPAGAIRSIQGWYHTDLWKGQAYRPEVWIEKDALIGVIEDVCEENDVPYFSCRGYTSQSEVWRAAQRMEKWANAGQQPYILHFGDHDPSGIDMTRDIRDRLEMFGIDLELTREALNMDQVQEYNPPPDPAKMSDSRATGYVENFGEHSWELDALEPSVFRTLIEDRLNGLKDLDLWDQAVEAMETDRGLLTETSDRWEEVVEHLAS